MRRFAFPLLSLLAVSACAHSDYGYGPPPPGYGYEGDDYAGRELDDLFRPDPWLEETREGQAILSRHLDRDGHPEAIRALNIRFRHFADTDRDMRLTDPEIRAALVRCAVHGWNW